MLSKALQKEFENGLPGSLYYLWSTEDCFIDDALARVTDIVIGDAPADFNYDLFDSSANPQEIIDMACTLPVLAQRRLVVVKEFNQFNASAVKVLKQYLDDPSASTCMVVFSAKAPKASQKFKWRVYPMNLKQWDIPAWLKQAAARRGLKLTSDAVECLIDFKGYEPGLLLMEIEKLKLSGSSTITDRDIISSTSMTRKYTSFDLVDTLIAGHKTRAFRILKIMLSGNAFDAPVILGTLNWHFKQFYSLWLNDGKRPVRMKDKTYKALLKYLPTYREDDFYRIFQNLHDADIGVKSSGRPEIVLEILLMRLLQKGAAS